MKPLYQNKNVRGSKTRRFENNFWIKIRQILFLNIQTKDQKYQQSSFKFTRIIYWPWVWLHWRSRNAVSNVYPKNCIAMYIQFAFNVTDKQNRRQQFWNQKPNLYQTIYKRIYIINVKTIQKLEYWLEYGKNRNSLRFHCHNCHITCPTLKYAIFKIIPIISLQLIK